MFGSDWPVCKVAGVEYKVVLNLANNLLSHLAPEDKHKIFHKNAIEFYKLKNVEV